jgi:hypothetical protein
MPTWREVRYGTIHLWVPRREFTACKRHKITDLDHEEYSGDECFVSCLSCRAISKWLIENNWAEVPLEVVEKYRSLGEGVKIDLSSFWKSPATIKDDITWEGMAVYGDREDKPIPGYPH